VFETCLDEGFRHFQGFWWNGTRVGSFTRRAPDGALFWQVGYPSQAEEAVAAGADVLVAQGTEAGGPVRTSLPVRELIRDLRAAVGDDIPLVAGGGLADGRDVADVLRAGAHAALLGTRFLLTDESDAPARDKGRLLRARSEDLILDPCLRGAWPCDPRRRMATPWGEDAPSLFAGTGVTRISSIRPAAAVLRDLRPRRAV
jgi:Dioxygenases related to 2-nitropropane dioxygenase